MEIVITRKHIGIAAIAIIIIVAAVLIFYIVRPEGNEEIDIMYLIDDTVSQNDPRHAERGVHFNEHRYPVTMYYFTIAMGERNTGGYSIYVEEVDIDHSGNVVITVRESSPESGQAVTTARTQPVARVILNHFPASVIVKNTEDGIFRNLNF